MPGNNDGGRGIPDHDEAIVVRRGQRLEKGRAGGEEREVLNIGIVLGVIRDEMVDIVGRFPPANGETTTEIRNKHANESICDEALSDATMTGIVGGKHDLMLRTLEE